MWERCWEQGICRKERIIRFILMSLFLCSVRKRTKWTTGPFMWKETALFLVGMPPWTLFWRISIMPYSSFKFGTIKCPVDLLLYALRPQPLWLQPLVLLPWWGLVLQPLCSLVALPFLLLVLLLLWLLVVPLPPLLLINLQPNWPSMLFLFGVYVEDTEWWNYTTGKLLMCQYPCVICCVDLNSQIVK